MSIQHIAEELARMKDEMTAMMAESGAAAFSSSREKVDEVAKMLGGVIDDIEQIVAREEQDVESFISSRPLASVAAAFLAGMAIGFILRRR